MVERGLCFGLLLGVGSLGYSQITPMVNGCVIAQKFPSGPVLYRLHLSRSIQGDTDASIDKQLDLLLPKNVDRIVTLQPTPPTVHDRSDQKANVYDVSDFDSLANFVEQDSFLSCIPKGIVAIGDSWYGGSYPSVYKYTFQGLGSENGHSVATVGMEEPLLGIGKGTIALSLSDGLVEKASFKITGVVTLIGNKVGDLPHDSTCEVEESVVRIDPQESSRLLQYVPLPLTGLEVQIKGDFTPVTYREGGVEKVANPQIGYLHIGKTDIGLPTHSGEWISSYFYLETENFGTLRIARRGSKHFKIWVARFQRHRLSETIRKDNDPSPIIRG